MVAGVPSLEGQLYLTDPQSIIAYTWRRYCRTPKNTIPILPDLIISLPAQVARFGKEPNILASNMQGDLQTVLDRVFNGERTVTVTVTAVPVTIDASDITVSFVYVLLNGEISQTGTSISLDKDGHLKIPEDTLPFSVNPQM